MIKYNLSKTKIIKQISNMNLNIFNQVLSKMNKWKFAKALIIFFCILVTSTLMTSCTMNKMIKKEIDHLLSQTDTTDNGKLDKNDINSLPYPVQNWLKQSGMSGKEPVKSVWLTQKAKMKMKPEQENWYNATAEQIFTVDNPGFVWTVKMKMSPIIKIKGRDKFIDGKGEMLIRMNSIINIVKEKGNKINEGTMQRFLGEIVWFPSAALSPYIKWEPIDSLSAKATMDYRGTKASGTFYFNEQGDFIKYSALRYKGNEPDAKPYEWVVNVIEHAIMDGVKIPVKMSATWKLDEGDWTWLELEVIDIQYNK